MATPNYGALAGIGAAVGGAVTQAAQNAPQPVETKLDEREALNERNRRHENMKQRFGMGPMDAQGNPVPLGAQGTPAPTGGWSGSFAGMPLPKPPTSVFGAPIYGTPPDPSLQYTNPGMWALLNGQATTQAGVANALFPQPPAPPDTSGITQNTYANYNPGPGMPGYIPPLYGPEGLTGGVGYTPPPLGGGGGGTGGGGGGSGGGGSGGGGGIDLMPKVPPVAGELTDFLPTLPKAGKNGWYQLPAALQAWLAQKGYGKSFADLLMALGMNGAGNIGQYGFEGDYFVPGSLAWSPQAMQMLAGLDPASQMNFRLILENVFGLAAAPTTPALAPTPVEIGTVSKEPISGGGETTSPTVPTYPGIGTMPINGPEPLPMGA